MSKKLNAWGTTLDDVMRQFDFRTQLYKYKHPDGAKLQDTTNFNEPNVYYDISLPNVELVDMESDLKGLTRKMSRLPYKKFQKNTTVTTVEPNNKVSVGKIIPLDPRTQFETMMNTHSKKVKS